MVRAGAIIATLPTLPIYVIMGRYFIRGSWPVRSRA